MEQRKTKYRAWDKWDEYMLMGGFSVNFAGIVFDNDPEKDRSLTILNRTELDRYIPMQYIGRKDVNKKDIYEGDIVKDGSFLMIIENDGFNWLSIIIGERDNEDGRIAILDEDDIKKFEVVGNKFENKELLK